ncbi:MAG: hypothetical protein K2H29_07140 [Oscillospiraceae bacterium]|nr:hypothetical protein [Oscillospiraceae bacterium]
MKNTKISAWDYLWYALYSFAGLGLEIVLISIIEPIFFGKISEYNTIQSIIHWILTILCWAIMMIVLVKSSEKKLDFRVWNHEKITTKGIVISLILIVACIALNAYDWGSLKIVGEFQKKELIEFIFQYIYYMFEIGLVFLIVVFGQKFVESLLKKKSMIPFGGIVLGCTWGLIHILTQGSIITGLGVIAFSLMYGIIYIALNRNTKYSYLAMVIAFII